MAIETIQAYYFSFRNTGSKRVLEAKNGCSNKVLEARTAPSNKV